MAGGQAVIVAGLGCRRDCAAAEIVALVRLAERRAGRRAEGLAAPAFKRREAGITEAAARLGLPLVFVDDAAMAEAQANCVTRSDGARRATGFASVAEAAALAVSNGPLLLPRIAGASATCALAGR